LLGKFLMHHLYLQAKRSSSGSAKTKRKKQTSRIRTLNAVCDGSFAHAKLSITPELIARLSTNWHGAHIKAAAANVISNTVISEEMVLRRHTTTSQLLIRRLRSIPSGNFRTDSPGQSRAARRQAERFWSRRLEAHHGSEEASGV
jgi:hypothetical protein